VVAQWLSEIVPEAADGAVLESARAIGAVAPHGAAAAAAAAGRDGGAGGGVNLLLAYLRDVRKEVEVRRPATRSSRRVITFSAGGRARLSILVWVHRPAPP
jgi:hypothetical protein